MRVEPDAQLVQVGDFEIGTQFVRPGSAVAIQPDREQAGLLGADDVHVGVVTDVGDLLRPKIERHDLEVKIRRAREFLTEHDKVKVTIRFRGREQERPAFGKDLLDRLAEDLTEVAVTEQTPKLEGRSMTMVLAPTRRGKAPVDAEAPEVAEVETVDE